MVVTRRPSGVIAGTKNPTLTSLAGNGAASSLASSNSLVPVPLTNGGTAWLLAPGAQGGNTPAASDLTQGNTGPLPGSALLDYGCHPRSASRSAPPSRSAAPQQTTGPAGYIPLQIQTAYGLSTGGAYNNNISFGGIKGDGTGQTIGIFEEGYNPAFVDTSAANYSTSALAVFDKTFGLPDPPSLTFVDHTGTPLSSDQQQQ